LPPLRTVTIVVACIDCSFDISGSEIRGVPPRDSRVRFGCRPMYARRERLQTDAGELAIAAPGW
jgi:hypothetical protein